MKANNNQHKNSVKSKEEYLRIKKLMKETFEEAEKQADKCDDRVLKIFSNKIQLY